MRCHRFTLKHLKDFGFGRAGLEGVIQGEVNIIFNDKITIKDFFYPKLIHHCYNVRVVTINSHPSQLFSSKKVEDLVNLFALHNGNDFRMETVFYQKLYTFL